MNLVVQTAQEIVVAVPTALIEFLELLLIVVFLSIRFSIELLVGAQQPERVKWLVATVRFSTLPLLILVVVMVIGKIFA